MTVFISPRRTTTASKVPTTSDLVDGEMGVNVTDKKIYQRVGSTVHLVGDVGGIGFTPVEQGGGAGMGTAKLRFGWSGAEVLAQVDAVPLGAVVLGGGAQSGLSGTKQWISHHTFTAGIDMGSTVATSPADLSKHLDLYGTGYGFSVTSQRLNNVVPNGGTHYFVVNGVDTAAINAAGISSTTGYLSAATYVTTPDTNGMGLRLWTNTGQYGVHMSAAGDATWGGRAPGETTSDYNTYFQMSGGVSRGWVFKHNSSAVAGVDSGGWFYGAGVVATGGIYDNFGNVRKLSFNTQNANYTLTTGDFNSSVEKSNTASYTYTLPNIGTQGQAITIVNSGTAGNITLARGSGVSLYRNGVNANITIGPGSMVTIYRSATLGRWIA